MYHFRVPCSSCVVIVIVIVIVNGNYSLGSEGICPGSKGQQGLCTTNSHGTLFQSHGDVATDPCHGHLCHEALDTFGHRTSATLTFDVQPEEHFTSPASRNTQRAQGSLRLNEPGFVGHLGRSGDGELTPERDHTREPRHVQWRDHTRDLPDDGNTATVSSSERGPIGSEPEPQRKNTLLDVLSARKRSMRLLRVDRASAPDQKDRSQGWVQSPLHNQGRNECLQDPKKMPAMPQDHL